MPSVRAKNERVSGLRFSIAVWKPAVRSSRKDRSQGSSASAAAQHARAS
jgi:hypothetical protein